MKRGDLLPILTGQALNKRTGEPINLASAPFPRFLMRAKDGTPAIISATVGATVTNATQGALAYVWQSGNTATVGQFEGEFEVTFPGTTPQTVPGRGYIPITIELDIG
jgi:hypothetical protein